MKLRSFGVLALVAFLTSCGGGEAIKETAQINKLAVPSWVTGTPNNSDSYDAVVTVSSEEGSVLAAQKGADQINAQVKQDLKNTYDAYFEKRAKQHSGLEKRVRADVVKQLPQMDILGVMVVSEFKNPRTGDVSIWTQLKNADVVANLEDSRLKLDQHLRNYVHVSDSGSNLNKLLSILPALPAIELKQQLAVYASHFSGQKAQALPNDRLAELLNLELSNSFSGLVLSLSSTTDESKPFEKALSRQMMASGLNMSAYKADLIVKYFIENDVESKNGLNNVTLVGDSEMLDSNGRSFATVGNEYQAFNVDQDVAINQALAAFSEDMVTVVSDSMTEFMNKANERQPLPAVFEN